jgi:hypothetical protein
MPDANRGPAGRTGEADMTHTESTCYGIPRETIENSMRRARRLRGRIVFRLARRMLRRLNPGRLLPVPAPIRPATQPA